VPCYGSDMAMTAPRSVPIQHDSHSRRVDVMVFTPKRARDDEAAPRPTLLYVKLPHGKERVSTPNTDPQTLAAAVGDVLARLATFTAARVSFNYLDERPVRNERWVWSHGDGMRREGAQS
jgi:hypothetical protein